MIRSLSQLKAAFVNGLTPDQSAFSDLIDTLGQVYSLNNQTEQFQFLGQWINQPNHGFSAGQIIYCSGMSASAGGVTTPVYFLASASSGLSTNAAGIVMQVQDANNFYIVTDGIISMPQVMLQEFLDPNVFPAGPYSLLAGAVYYLSDLTPGTATTSPPSTVGHFNIQIGIAQTSGGVSSSAIFILRIINQGLVSSAVTSSTNLLTFNGGSIVRALYVYNAGQTGAAVTFNSANFRLYAGGSFSSLNGSIGQQGITRLLYNSANTGLLSYDSSWLSPGSNGFNNDVYAITSATTDTELAVVGQFTSYSNLNTSAGVDCAAQLSMATGASLQPPSPGTTGLVSSVVEIGSGYLLLGGFFPGAATGYQMMCGLNTISGGGALTNTPGTLVPGSSVMVPPSAYPNMGGRAGVTSLFIPPSASKEIIITGEQVPVTFSGQLTNDIYVAHVTNIGGYSYGQGSDVAMTVDYVSALAVVGQINGAWLDLGYGPTGGAASYTTVSGGLLQDPSGTGTVAQAAAIIVAGNFSSLGGVACPGLARLTLPTTTSTPGTVLAGVCPYTGNAPGHYASSRGPTITISGGGGVGATAVPVMTPSSGPFGNVYEISGVTITNPGSGYTSTPTATLSGGSPYSLQNEVLLILNTARNLTLDATTTFPALSGAAYGVTRCPAIGSVNDGTLFVWGSFSDVTGEPNLVPLVAPNGVTSTHNCEGAYAVATQAVAGAITIPGGVLTVAMTNAGHYSAAPTVTLVGGSVSSGSATATATITGGVVSITSTGVWTAAPTSVIISAPFVATVNGPVYSLVIDQVPIGSGGTGNIIIGGAFTSVNGQSRIGIAQLDQYGNVL